MDRITYIGHGTTLLSLDGAELLTDPFLLRGLGPLRRQAAPPADGLAEGADAVLISHAHRDHLDVRSLRRLPASTPLLVPKGAGQIAARGGGERIQEISLGERVSLAGVDVTAVPATHDGRRDRWSSPLDAYGYLIEAGGRRVYFAGDTDIYPEMAELAPLDLALIPVWGWGPSVGEGHLEPESAARALTLLRPKVAVPIHWGTFYPLGLSKFRPGPLADPPHEFARIAAELAPDVKVSVLQPGSDLPLTP